MPQGLLTIYNKNRQEVTEPPSTLYMEQRENTVNFIDHHETD